MRIPKYSRHSSGNARVCLGGKYHYLGKYGTKASKDEYNRLVGEWIASGGVVIPGTANDELSIAEMLLAYMKWAKSYYANDARQIGRIKRVKDLFKEQGYLTKSASSFGYVQFESVRTSLVKTGVGRKYVNELMDRIVRIFKWAASRGLIPPAVHQTLSLIERLAVGRTTAPEANPVLPVDEAIVNQTLPHLPQVVADMVRFQIRVGCRPGEVCLIKPSMVDRSDESGVWEIHLDEHKKAYLGKKRILFVGPRGQEVLAKYLLRDPDLHCFSPIDSERKRLDARHEARITPLSIGNKPGSNRERKPKRKPRDHYDKDTFRHAIHRACDKAFPAPSGLSADEQKSWRNANRWNPNRLRHSFATASRKVAGIEATSILMGHSDAAAVTTIYAERNRQDAIEAIRKLG